MFNYIVKLTALIFMLSFSCSQSTFAYEYTTVADGFPSGGGGCIYGCGSTGDYASNITFAIKSNDDFGSSPVMFNFIASPVNPNVGRFCISGQVQATYTSETESGTATYSLLSTDESSKGICYSNVTRSCSAIPLSSAGSETEKCIYTSRSLDIVPANELKDVLNGRFKIDISREATGPYYECIPPKVIGEDESGNPSYEEKTYNPNKNICNIEVGFGFGFEKDASGEDIVVDGYKTPLPAIADFFPAGKTLNNDDIDSNVISFASEICVSYDPQAFDGYLDTDAVAFESKPDTGKFTLCEALAAKVNWCHDAQSTEDAGKNYRPSCVTKTSTGAYTVASLNVALGSSQNQYSEAVCVDNVSDLRTLAAYPEEVSIAGCASGPGYITFPDSVINSSDSETFTFSSADGGGTSNIINLVGIGAYQGVRGYVGDNTIPPIKLGWTAVVSTPDNQPNTWEFSGVKFTNVAFVHGRNNDDTITGTDKADTILGGSGADTLNGGAGNDLLQGGDNVDKLNGNEGNDVLLGYECTGPNADCSTHLNKGSDNDILVGGSGDDCLDGGRGYDTLTGDGGADAFVLYGTTNGDTITDFELGIDEVVNLTGNGETAQWIVVKEVGSCKVKTGGGSNGVVIQGLGITDTSSCESVTVTTSLPSQCASHPATFN